VQAIKAEGAWSLGARAGDFVFVAGMQGIDPATNKLIKAPKARIRHAFLNSKNIAESEGASLKDCVRLTIYLSDLPRYAPMVEKAQAELWGGQSYPPRTMIEVKRLFDDEHRGDRQRVLRAAEAVSDPHSFSPTAPPISTCRSK